MRGRRVGGQGSPRAWARRRSRPLHVSRGEARCRRGRASCWPYGSYEPSRPSSSAWLWTAVTVGPSLGAPARAVPVATRGRSRAGGVRLSLSRRVPAGDRGSPGGPAAQLARHRGRREGPCPGYALPSHPSPCSAPRSTYPAPRPLPSRRKRPHSTSEPSVRRARSLEIPQRAMRSPRRTSPPAAATLRASAWYRVSVAVIAGPATPAVSTGAGTTGAFRRRSGSLTSSGCTAPRRRTATARYTTRSSSRTFPGQGSASRSASAFR